jgi:hypothetical protein
MKGDPAASFGQKTQQTCFLFLILLSQYNWNGHGKIKEQQVFTEYIDQWHQLTK